MCRLMCYVRFYIRFYIRGIGNLINIQKIILISCIGPTFNTPVIGRVHGPSGEYEAIAPNSLLQHLFLMQGSYISRGGHVLDNL